MKEQEKLNNKKTSFHFLKMLSLNIQMQSFELAKNIVHDNDSIRISVTTLPGEQKQAFSFDAKKMKTVHPFFSVKIDDKTEKILIVVRKKNFTEKDPIIASTVIKSGQFPTKFNDVSNTELKTINLLEPLQHSGKRISKSTEDRKVVGKVDLCFTLTQEIECQKNLFKPHFNKKRNGQGYAKMDSFLLCDDENLITN